MDKNNEFDDLTKFTIDDKKARLMDDMHKTMRLRRAFIQWLNMQEQTFEDNRDIIVHGEKPLHLNNNLFRGCIRRFYRKAVEENELKLAQLKEESKAIFK